MLYGRKKEATLYSFLLTDLDILGQTVCSIFYCYNCMFYRVSQEKESSYAVKNVLNIQGL